MHGSQDELLGEVASYYAGKLALHGDTPAGVDWNGAASQTLRFEQLARLLPGPGDAFSLNDLGCGYGALFEFLQHRYPQVQYVGIDVSAEMIDAACRRVGSGTAARFVTGAAPDGVADYGVASGIFNVRLGRSDAEWQEYLEHTLDVLDKSSRKGFAFNCLTAYSDADRMRPELYYADPCRLFDLCKRRYARNVALLHDYGLYEFTMLVRKTT